MTVYKQSTLVFGGASSGKSLYSEKLALQSGLKLHYIATAYRNACDNEMTAKIEHHRHRRMEQADWKTHEIGTELCDILKDISHPEAIILVDCLTLWLGNIVCAHKEPDLDNLCDTIGRLNGPVIFVSNELGLGGVPQTSMGRKFRNMHGEMNQRVATCVKQVVFVAAGLPLVLK